MGLSASQGRMLLLTARRNDLEFRAQQISQKRLNLSQQLEQISLEYEAATSNRQMQISMYSNGVSEDGKAITRTTNLTYSALVSGAVAKGAAVSGIQASDAVGTVGLEFASNTAYRLKSADGAIVVADISEIPTTVPTTNMMRLPKEQNSNHPNIYTTKNVTGDDVTTNSTTNYYVVLPIKDANSTDGSSEENTTTTNNTSNALRNAIGDNATAKVELDVNQGLVKIVNNDTVTYYNVDTGEQISDEAQITKLKDTFTPTDNPPSFKNAESEITDGTSTLTSYEVVTPRPGADGVYTLYDSNGLPAAGSERYVVDQSLKYGSTDVNGVAGPNYLQDCLRNGKYLIEKHVVDNNTNEKFRWASVSWDATTNISDSYYTEDDDAAKAKYDRLQQEIQNQDKKLELELDNIETQRSAITTEEESVKKVKSDNIDGTFKVFA